MGGLPRRATIVDSLREDGTSPLFVADAGNFAWKSGRLDEAALPQQRRKAEAILDAFQRDQIDAVGIGVNDLVLGVDWVRQATETRQVPTTLANLSCDGQAPFPGHQLTERDGVRVGFVGILSEDRIVDGCEVTDRVAALRRELRDMGPVHMLVVFGHGSNDDDQTLAEAVPEIDVIVNAQVRATLQTPNTLPGGAIQIAAGSRGKKLGVAEITMVQDGQGFADPDALEQLQRRRDGFTRRLDSAQRNLSAEDEGAQRRAQRQQEYFTEKLAALDEEIAALESRDDGPAHTIRVALTELDRGVSDHPDAVAILESAKADIAELEGEAVVAALTDTPYLGSAACSGCHAEIYAQWQETGHARAYATLQAEERELDRDCYTCHVTGAFSEEGPQHPTQVTEALQGVGCESCHGPGRSHVAAPGAGTMERSPGEANCVQCHDGKQDEGRFNLETYLPRVAHQSP